MAVFIRKFALCRQLAGAELEPIDPAQKIVHDEFALFMAVHALSRPKLPAACIPIKIMAFGRSRVLLASLQRSYGRQIVAWIWLREELSGMYSTYCI